MAVSPVSFLEGPCLTLLTSLRMCPTGLCSLCVQTARQSLCKIRACGDYTSHYYHCRKHSNPKHEAEVRNNAPSTNTLRDVGDWGQYGYRSEKPLIVIRKTTKTYIYILHNTYISMFVIYHTHTYLCLIHHCMHYTISCSHGVTMMTRFRSWIQPNSQGGCLVLQGTARIREHISSFLNQTQPLGLGASFTKFMSSS